jgi:hypothetical protein
VESELGLLRNEKQMAEKILRRTQIQLDELRAASEATNAIRRREQLVTASSAERTREHVAQSTNQEHVVEGEGLAQIHL